MPQHTIRLRLTVLYGVVSVLSAAGLLAVIITLAGGWQEGTAPVPAGPAASQQASLAQALARITLLQAQVDQGGATWSHRLLVAAAASLAVMAVASVVLGWVVAGRALSPLRR